MIEAVVQADLFAPVMHAVVDAVPTCKAFACYEPVHMFSFCRACYDLLPDWRKSKLLLARYPSPDTDHYRSQVMQAVAYLRAHSMAEKRKPEQPHTCHAEGCMQTINPMYLMCLRHWNMVPPDVQRAIYTNRYRRGSHKVPRANDYLEAVKKAKECVRKAEARD
jgi:hypothetical protein